MTIFRMGSATYDAVRNVLELQRETAIIRIDNAVPPGTIYVDGVTGDGPEENPEVMLKS